MHLLYSVVGEGRGHATRSEVIIRHLLAQGHEVTILASGQALAHLKGLFGGVHKIHGLHMLYVENRVRIAATLASNVTRGLAALPGNLATLFKTFEKFGPQAVITDFESEGWLYGKLHSLPILSVDNMQVIHRCTLPEAAIDGYEREFLTAKAIVKGKVPHCDRYFITSFFQLPTRKPNTQLFPPILRDAILDVIPWRGEHLLVYTTGQGNHGFMAALKKSGLPCRVYGVRRDITEDVTDANLTYRPISQAQFIADLASCRAVVAGGGFSLMGEAVHLGKPMLALPMQKQFEQILNARMLEQLDYGQMAVDLNDVETLPRFLDAIPRHAVALAGYRREGNGRILTAIEAWLASLPP